MSHLPKYKDVVELYIEMAKPLQVDPFQRRTNLRLMQFLTLTIIIHHYHQYKDLIVINPSYITTAHHRNEHLLATLLVCSLINHYHATQS